MFQNFYFGLRFILFFIKNKAFAVQVVLTMVNQNLHTVLMAGGKEVMRREFEDFSLLDQMYSGFKIL